jgi:hypothetical protein
MATSTAVDRAAPGVTDVDGANRVLSNAVSFRIDPVAHFRQICTSAELVVDESEAKSDWVKVLEAMRVTDSALAGGEDTKLSRLWVRLLMARARARLGYHEVAFRSFYGHLHAAASLVGGFPALDRALGAGDRCEVGEFTIATLEAFGSSLPYTPLTPAARTSCTEFGCGLLRGYSSSTMTIYRRSPQMASSWLGLLDSRDPLHTKLKTLLFSTVVGSSPRPPTYISTPLDRKVAA